MVCTPLAILCSLSEQHCDDTEQSLVGLYQQTLAERQFGAMNAGLKAMLVQQPGDIDPQRVYCEVGNLAGAFRLNVEPGADLLDSIERWGTQRGSVSIAFRLLSGRAATLRVMTGGVDPSGARAATFHGPHDIECPACVLGGHGVLGRGYKKAALHAHAVFLDLHGRARGCHLMRGHCLAASTGIQVAMFDVRGAGFQVQRDSETQFDLFFPRATASTRGGKSQS